MEDHGMEQKTASTTELDTETKTTKLNTPFGEIEYRPEFKLTSASIMQLLYCYTERLNTQKPLNENKWQEYAYPKLLSLFTEFRDNATVTVKKLCEDENLDRDVVMINFCGYKNFKLPITVPTKYVNPRSTYSTVNVRPFLRTLEQRLNYLSTSDVPVRYKGDQNKINTFLKVQETAKMLVKQLEPLHELWKKICQEAAECAGLKMENKNYNNYNNYDHKPRQINRYPSGTYYKKNYRQEETRGFRNNRRKFG